MGKDLNKVMITGNLGADPEMRYTPQGSAVTNFRVATGRQWKSADGQQHQETEWFRVVAWDKLAEICNQYLEKGVRVYIEGRLATRSWQDDKGETRYTTEVVASDMIILSAKGAQPAKAEDGGVGEDDWMTPPDRSAPTLPPATQRSSSRGEGGYSRPIQGHNPSPGEPGYNAQRGSTAPSGRGTPARNGPARNVPSSRNDNDPPF